MYKIEILPIARHDMINIFNYNLNELNNKSAARDLNLQFRNAIKYINLFPYGLAEYNSVDKLKYKYRSMKVKNYLIFYIIDEDSKTVIITRILYKKMNIEDMLY